eukprot:scaffold285496_cov17-Tisochrysis_lutea.AAC.1
MLGFPADTDPKCQKQSYSSAAHSCSLFSAFHVLRDVLEWIVWPYTFNHARCNASNKGALGWRESARVRIGRN